MFIYLGGTGGWVPRQRGEERAALRTRRSLDKALFLIREVTSACLQADLQPLVNSILSISGVEADNNADMDKTVLQSCE